MIQGKTDQPMKRYIIHAFMIFLGLLAIVPVYILIINATRSTEQINLGLAIVPGTNAMYNWNALTSRGFQIWQGFGNSAFISISTTVLSIYFSALTAYGLHVYKFKGRVIIWTIILIIMMLPGSLTFIGFYQQMASWRLTDTYLPLILPGIAAAATVLFIRQYMSSVLSMELVDAARIDGAGEYRIFNVIIIPVIVPALAAQSIFTFIGSWNNFITRLSLFLPKVSTPCLCWFLLYAVIFTGRSMAEFILE